jgi:sensor histidine kinase YesM
MNHSFLNLFFNQNQETCTFFNTFLSFSLFDLSSELYVEFRKLKKTFHMKKKNTWITRAKSSQVNVCFDEILGDF